MYVSFASLNAFVISYSQSDFFGKVIILGLIGLSVLCWIVLLHKLWIISKVRKFSQAFQKALELNKEALLTVDLSVFPKPKSDGIPHPYAKIFHALKQKTMEILNKNHYFLRQGGQSKGAVYLTKSDLELVEAHVMTTISLQNKELEKNLFVLSTIVTLAPFMGLLGTVWGILMTFSGLHEGGAVSSNSAILGGLSTALATTVLGLIIAIPALVSYNYFKNALRVFGSDMDDFLSHLISTIELQYKKVE